jgi:dTDP-4-dehydrorhamnose reductase
MKAIVVGADGTIGSALSAALVQRGDTVYGTTRRRELANARRPFLDLASPDVQASALPDAEVAFFCAGIVGYAKCRSHPDLARQVNVTTPVGLARRLTTVGTHVVLLSTNAVFDGREPKVPARRLPCPTTVYGHLAAEAEQGFGALGPDASIARLTKLITADAPRFARWIAALSDGETIAAFSDLYMSPISLDDAISSLLAIADARIGGIFQISGADDISYHEAARYIASRLGVSPDLVQQKSASKADMPIEGITRFSSLDASRIAELTGLPAPDPRTVLEATLGHLLPDKV